MISIPEKPTATAAHCRGLTRSPSKGTDRPVTTSGVSASTACTSASGSRPNAQMTRPISVASRSARQHCSQGRREGKERLNLRGGRTTSNNEREQQHSGKCDRDTTDFLRDRGVTPERFLQDEILKIKRMAGNPVTTQSRWKWLPARPPSPE